MRSLWTGRIKHRPTICGPRNSDTQYVCYSRDNINRFHVPVTHPSFRLIGSFNKNGNCKHSVTIRVSQDPARVIWLKIGTMIRGNGDKRLLIQAMLFQTIEDGSQQGIDVGDRQEGTLIGLDNCPSEWLEETLRCCH